MSFLSRIVLILALTTLAGCFSGGPGLDFGNVSGKVTLKGKPLPHATVKFQPESGRPSYGKTNEAGEYSLNFMGKEWGAIVGNHAVWITTEDRIENQETGESRWQPEVLPPKYNTKTTLSAVVEPGDNVHNFDLEEMKKGAKFPSS